MPDKLTPLNNVHYTCLNLPSWIQLHKDLPSYSDFLSWVVFNFRKQEMEIRRRQEEEAARKLEEANRKNAVRIVMDEL